MMKGFLRLLGSLLGFALQFVGLTGGSDQVASWSPFLGLVHDYFGNPFIYIPCTLVGTVVLIGVWGEYVAERTLARAGGITKREFKASIGHWDLIDNFTVWQVAWLWNGLEPQRSVSEPAEGTRAYPTFRWLMENSLHLCEPGHQAEFSAASVLSRQKLIDFALSVEQRPAFLFKHERHLKGKIISAARRLRGIYLSEFDVKHEFPYEIGNLINAAMLSAPAASQTSYTHRMDAFRTELEQMLHTGSARAAGRREIDGWVFDYEKIPARGWGKLRIAQYSHDAVGRYGLFKNLRVFLPKAG